MELTLEDVSDALSEFARRVEIIKAVGGVAHQEVVQNRLDISATHYLDPQTSFWISRGVEIITPPPRPPA